MMSDWSDCSHVSIQERFMIVMSTGKKRGYICSCSFLVLFFPSLSHLVLFMEPISLRLSEQMHTLTTQ